MPGEYVYKEVCEERHHHMGNDLQEIKQFQKQCRDGISKKIDMQFATLKDEVVGMVKAASDGKPIKIENHWKTKDKILVIGAVFGSPVLVKVIEALAAALL